MLEHIDPHNISLFVAQPCVHIYVLGDPINVMSMETKRIDHTGFDCVESDIGVVHIGLKS